MSILGFLRIAQKAQAPATNVPASEGFRPRRLIIESLERRSVLTTAGALAAAATADPPAAWDPSTTLPESIHYPAFYGQLPGESFGDAEPLVLPAEPPSEEGYTEPLPDYGEPSSSTEPGGEGGESEYYEEYVDEYVSPVITLMEHLRLGPWVSIFGTVEDDDLIAGLTVYFSTDMGHQFTATLAVDGTFMSQSILTEYGTQVAAYVIDTDGNWSDVAVIIV